MNHTTKEPLEMIIQQFKELTGVYRSAVSHIGIRENEFWIWYTLVIMEAEYTQQDICRLWSMSKQTVNNIITNMVQKEYALLETVPGTRNRKIIRLTETGKQYGTSIVAPVWSAEENALNRLNPEELVACAKTLSKLCNYLKEGLYGNDKIQ